MNLIIIIITIIPYIIIGKYIYKKSEEKISKKTIIKLILSGILIYFISGELNNFSKKMFNLSNESNTNFILHLIKYIFSIALTEELLKFLASYFIGIKNKYKNTNNNIIIITYYVALSFAIIENVDYILSHGYITGLLRAIFSIPGHIIWGIIMGYFINLAYYEKNNNKKYYKNILLSIIIPILYHALYDAVLTYKSHIKFLILPLQIFIIIYTLKQIKKATIQNNLTKEKNIALNLIILFTISTIIFTFIL